jgi:hypothetical protein
MVVSRVRLGTQSQPNYPVITRDQLENLNVLFAPIERKGLPNQVVIPSAGRP